MNGIKLDSLAKSSCLRHGDLAGIWTHSYVFGHPKPNLLGLHPLSLLGHLVHLLLSLKTTSKETWGCWPLCEPPLPSSQGGPSPPLSLTFLNQQHKNVQMVKKDYHLLWGLSNITLAPAAGLYIRPRPFSKPKPDLSLELGQTNETQPIRVRGQA